MFDVSHATARPLPRSINADGEPRAVGVEIELGGLPEDKVARLVQEQFGGTLCESDGKLKLVDTELGTFEVYLDTRFRTEAETVLADLGRSLARLVVPVEIVTSPINPRRLPHLQEMCNRLRRAGALGTEDGMLLGFGVHLNVEIASEEIGPLVETLTAYALLEDVLRDEDQIDGSRRMLPFTDPYPRDLLDALTKNPPNSLRALTDLYLEHTPTRNRGLDMLPVLKHLDPARFESDDAPKTASRPTYHYRLPDCRIDDPQWSLLYEWNRWVQIETIASDPEVMARLRKEWQAHRAAWTTTRLDWPDTARQIVETGEHVR